MTWRNRMRMSWIHVFMKTIFSPHYFLMNTKEVVNNCCWQWASQTAVRQESRSCIHYNSMRFSSILGATHSGENNCKAHRAFIWLYKLALIFQSRGRAPHKGPLLLPLRVVLSPFHAAAVGAHEKRGKPRPSKGIRRLNVCTWCKPKASPRTQWLGPRSPLAPTACIDGTNRGYARGKCICSLQDGSFHLLDLMLQLNSLCVFETRLLLLSFKTNVNHSYNLIRLPLFTLSFTSFQCPQTGSVLNKMTQLLTSALPSDTF